MRKIIDRILVTGYFGTCIHGGLAAGVLPDPTPAHMEKALDDQTPLAFRVMKIFRQELCMRNLHVRLIVFSSLVLLAT